MGRAGTVSLHVMEQGISRAKFFFRGGPYIVF